MKPKLRNMLLFFSGMIIIPVVGYIGLKVLKIIPTQDPTFKEKTFDCQLWRNGDRRARGEMVQNLQDSKILYNLTKVQVFELLGVPDENDTCGDAYYTVDVGRLFIGHMVPEQLFISFDKDGRVMKFGRVD